MNQSAPTATHHLSSICPFEEETREEPEHWLALYYFMAGVYARNVS